MPLNGLRLISKCPLNQKTLHLEGGRGVAERFASAPICRLGRALEEGSRRNKVQKLAESNAFPCPGPERRQLHWVVVGTHPRGYRGAGCRLAPARARPRAHWPRTGQRDRPPLPGVSRPRALPAQRSPAAVPGSCAACPRVPPACRGPAAPGSTPRGDAPPAPAGQRLRYSLRKRTLQRGFAPPTVRDALLAAHPVHLLLLPLDKTVLLSIGWEQKTPNQRS